MSDSEEDEVHNRTVKITVVGEPSTGKSSLCARYLGAECGGGTPGAAVLAGECRGLRPAAPLQLCDVAGAARATGMLRNYLYSTDAVLFVYDLTNLQSFENLSIWVTTVKEIFEPEPKKPLMAVFGNKSDLEHQRAVRLSCVQKFASEHLLENYKGSARTGEMVNTAFTNLVAGVLGVKPRAPPARSPRRAESPPGPRQSLVMNRQALRRIQRASSSVCAVQ